MKSYIANIDGMFYGPWADPLDAVDWMHKQTGQIRYWTINALHPPEALPSSPKRRRQRKKADAPAVTP